MLSFWRLSKPCALSEILLRDDDAYGCESLLKNSFGFKNGHALKSGFLEIFQTSSRDGFEIWMFLVCKYCLRLQSALQWRLLLHIGSRDR